jgi:hypothetical protein
MYVLFIKDDAAGFEFISYINDIFRASTLDVTFLFIRKKHFIDHFYDPR